MFIYFLLTIKEYINTSVLLSSDGPVSFYQVGDKADGYNRMCLLPLANLYFPPVYSNGPSSTFAEDVQL
jgi:hypothetical protein